MPQGNRCGTAEKRSAHFYPDIATFEFGHLAVIGHISIIAIWAAVAGELVNNILADAEIEQNSEVKKY